MGFILGLFGGKSHKTQPTIASGLQLQSSTYGQPVPIVYGATRGAPNVMWYGDFVATPQPSSSGSGGKGGVGGGGGGKGGGGSTAYTYQTAVQLGLCEGPITGVGDVYVGKATQDLASLSLTLSTGTYPQSPWSYLIANHAAVGETHTIPGSPYQVTVTNASTFLFDGGVTGQTVTVQFTLVNSSPGANQYSRNGPTYNFNSANAGQSIIIRFKNTQAIMQSFETVIPNQGSYTVNVNSTARGQYYQDFGVTQIAAGYTPVVGAPGVNQYSVAAGVYTFNAANTGLDITINYASTAQAEPYAALGYNGIAHADASAYQLGNSPQLPNHNFEIFGVLYNSTGVGGVIDADPSQVIADFLSNTHYGAGFPSARLGSLTTYQNYTLALGLWISPAYVQQTAAATILDDLATQTNSAWVWSEGVLNLVPYGDQSVTANGYTYTAPAAPVYALTVDDYEPNNAGAGAGQTNDPIQITRKRPADQINSVKLEALDRSNQYNAAVVEAKDTAAIFTYGLRQAPTRQAHLFCDLNAAKLSAALQLGRQAIRNIYYFQLDQRYIGLDPMDIVSVTEIEQNLSAQWVRITEITENDDRTLSVVAEEYLTGTGNAPLYAFQSGQGFSANYNETPGTTNAPIIFEPPVQVTAAASLETWIVASGQSNWGGCDVWLSTDGNTYKLAGRVTGPARQGVTTATFASGSDPDTANTLSVNLTASQGQLISGTQDDADAGHTLCYVGGELVAYQTATLTALYRYNLGTYIRRGMYGTTIASHASGSAFARLDEGIFAYPYDKSQLGQTIYVKLLPFNIYGGGQPTLADVDAYTHVIVGPPVPPAIQNFTAQQQGNVVAFKWADLQPTDVGLVGYDIAYAQQGETDWSRFLLLTEAHRGTEMTNASVPPGTWTFGIRGHDIADQLGAMSTFDLTVTNPDTVILDALQEPTWPDAFSYSFCYPHYTGVLLPKGLHTSDFYTQLSAPSTLILGQTSGGSLSGATYYVKATYVTATGETTASSESSLAVSASNLLTVSGPNSVNATGWNVYVSTSTGTETLQNAAPVAPGDTWTLPAGGLVTGVAPPTTNTTGWEVFDVFVPNPLPIEYLTPIYDTGYDDTLRVFTTYRAVPGPGQTGQPNVLETLIGTTLTGDPNPFPTVIWTIGNVLMRYVNALLVATFNGTGVNPGNVCYLTDFTLAADKEPVIENSGGSVTIAPGGTAITFPTPFHTPPNVQCTSVAATDLNATAASITTTGFTAHVFSGGSDVGGVINWTATGT